jgi:hypothetical protein
MSHPYGLAALARERQDMLLAEARAARQARQARTQRDERSTPATRRSPFRRTPAWLASVSSLLLARRAAEPVPSTMAKEVCGP